MYRIEKEFAFSAAHQLVGLRPDHPCSRLHGHNYRVVVVLESPTLDGHSFVVDYNDLAPLKRYIDDQLDHRHLNDALGFQTTAESIARHLFDFCRALWPQTVEVRVSETPKTWASYREGSA